MKKKGEVIDSLSLPNSKPEKVSLLLKNDLNVVEEIDQDVPYQFQTKLHSLSLPMKKGEVVGEVYVMVGKEKVSFEEIVLEEDLSKYYLRDVYFQNIKNMILGNF